METFCKSCAKPIQAEEGLYRDLNPKLEGKLGNYGDVSEFSSDELEALDAEGWAVITKHKIRYCYSANLTEVEAMNFYLENQKLLYVKCPNV